MTALAQSIAQFVAEYARRYAGGADGVQREARLVFLGPPLEILEQVYACLTEAPLNGKTPRVPLPVLLQVPKDRLPAGNPPVGESGWCDQSHLLTVRDTASAPSFLALVPPDQHMDLSILTAVDLFGVGTKASSRLAAFDAWWTDPFVQQVIDRAVAELGLNASRASAIKLMEAAARAEDQVDLEGKARIGAWRVLARAMDRGQPPVTASAATRLAAACGVPPTEAGDMQPELQLKALDAISSAFEDGFKAGVEGALANSTDEDERQALNDFKVFVERACDIPTLFEQAPQAYYAPSRGLTFGPLPSWWITLTADRWLELLEDSQPAKTDVVIEILNPLTRITFGGITVVADGAQLRITSDAPFEAKLERRVGTGINGLTQWPLPLQPGGTTHACDVPAHKSPVRLNVVALDGTPIAGLKLISLATWQPGVHVQCRTAQKVVPAKRAKTHSPNKVIVECGVVLQGPGRHLIDVFASPSRELSNTAVLRMQEGQAGISEEASCEVHRVVAQQYAIEVDASGDCELEFAITDRSTDTPVHELCKVHLTCAEVRVTGCSSEFDRLVREHRGGKRAAVQVDSVARSSVLEAWILDEDKCRLSWQPSVLATDYAKAWAPPSWGSGHGPLFSRSRFISDPRPSWDEWSPPDGFVQARQDVLKRIRGEEGTGLTAQAQLGHWANTDSEFRELVERYLDQYMAWLANDPDTACWVDVVAVASTEHGTDTLSPRLDAILLPPVHPLRLAWMCGAQSVLLDALRRAMPCPAAALLDADVVPDIFVLSARGPDATEPQTFIAVECSSDYWSVLWSADRLRELALRAQEPPFGPELGITVGGLARGFSPSQVAKALADVSDLLPAKPILSISLTSSGAAVDSCNEGIADWSRRRYSPDGEQASREYLRIGPKMLEVRDARPATARPDEPMLSNLVEDTGGAVRWFLGGKNAGPVDLAVITQLEAADPALSQTNERSAISAGALLRHRIRRQLPRAGQSYLMESRQAGSLPERTGSTLLDKLAHAIVQIENSPPTRLGFRFSPDIQAIRNALQEEHADFVAVSSSAVDPSCFVGEWIEGAYLWDYSLPSYSQRAGDTAGTYLISRIKETDRDAMRSAVTQLPGAEMAANGQLDALLSEVARRGIPTVRELSGDDTKAAGALGMFVAARVLQDAFRADGAPTGLLDVQRPASGGNVVAVVIPVDPFSIHLEELANSIRPSKELSGRRPDLLVLTMEVGAIFTRIRIVPLEVKWRTAGPMSKEDCVNALGQAKALSEMLKEIVARAADVLIWKLALGHLIVSMVSFGMRIYGQNKNIVQDPREWAEIHERAASSILGGSASIEVDDVGRLIVIDPSAGSSPFDKDGDGFLETIVLSREDAARVMFGDAASLYDVMRARLGDWNTSPTRQNEQTQPIPSADGPLPVGPKEPLGIAAPERTPATEARRNAEEVPDTASADRVPANYTARLPSEASEPIASEERRNDLGIVLRLGTTTGQFETKQVELNISDTRLNQLNVGVVGDLGTGKTQLLKSLITQIVSSQSGNRGIKPRFMIFDYKKDYSSADFVEAVGARVIKPFRMPLNIFDTAGMVDSNVPWLERFKFFADVLEKIFPGIGPVQRDKLKQAVRGAYETAAPAGRVPTIYDVRAEYHSILAGKSDAPLAIIDDLVDSEVFLKDPPPGSSFGTFFEGVVVVSLASMGQDDRSKNMVVAMMLNMFYESMLGLPKRPFLGSDPQLRAIDSYLLVDEADNIMQYEFDVLRKLLLQGREFGVGVILASQYLRHFKVNATDYRDPLLTWFVHKVPNITPAELAGLGLTSDLADFAERVKTLPNHHCLYKSFGDRAAVIQGLPFFQLTAKKA